MNDIVIPHQKNIPHGNSDEFETYPVVYSYKRSKTRELELSLESLRNIKEWNGTSYVIGDKPDVEGGYTHLPIKYTWGKESRIPSNDEVCAYLTAADFLDKFIILADDIFILKPWSLAYQNRGSLEEHAASRHGGGWYTRQLLETKNFLLSNGKGQLSYEMHIPTLVTAEQIKEASELIRSNKPMFIRSIIGNWNAIESIKSEDPKLKPITKETTIYSSLDSQFKYEEIRKNLQ